MVFDGDDDWALSHEAWEFVLAAGDKVIDDFGEDLEALRSGSRAFTDTSMFQELPALHVGRYAAEFAGAVLAATKAAAAKLL